jgi:Tfp pilus assembly protein PilV
MRIVRSRQCHQQLGITLSEVVISIAVSAMSVAAVVSSYVLSARSADFISHTSAADLAAQARMEQTRAAKWDTAATPVVDEVMSTNFPAQIVPLYAPVVGGTMLYGTNYTTIAVVSQDPPLKYVQVDCVWSYPQRGPFTNTIVAYRSPDQ